MMRRWMVELVVPVLNEENNLPAFYDEVERVFREKIAHVDWRVMFVGDGSSWVLLGPGAVPTFAC